MRLSIRFAVVLACCITAAVRADSAEKEPSENPVEGHTQSGAGTDAAKPSDSKKDGPRAIRIESNNVRVTILPEVGWLALEDIFAKKVRVTEEKYLYVMVSVWNKSNDKKIDFEGWSSNMFMAFAFLKDNLGNRYKLIDFGPNVTYPGKIESASIYPGKGTLEVLIFETPIEKASTFELTLKGKNVGEDTDFVFHFPRSVILDTDEEARRMSVANRIQPFWPRWLSELANC